MKSIVAAVAALAVTTQGFLLPPDVSESDIDTINPFGLATGQNRVVEVPCPGCPVQVMDRHGKVHVKTHKPNHLTLVFRVEQKDGFDNLEVNGMQLYPFSEVFQTPLTAPQTIEKHPHRKHDGNWAEKHHKDRKGHNGPSHRRVLDPQLGYSVVSSRQEDVVYMDFQINSVNRQFVDGIPSVNITLALHDKDQLTVDNINLVASANAGSHVAQGQHKHCNRLCQWLTSIYKLGRPAGGCANKNKHGARPAVVLPSHHKYRPGQVHRPQRTWAQLVRNIVSHILFPILIGIVAGVGASLIGMMAGTFVVMVWRTLSGRQPGRCRHRCRYSRRQKEAQKEAGVIEEKAGLMDEQAPPPAYEEETAQVEGHTEVQEASSEGGNEEVPKA